MLKFIFVTGAILAATYATAKLVNLYFDKPKEEFTIEIDEEDNVYY